MSETWWVNAAQLDKDQKEVVQLPLGGSHLIIGPPGSGKTNLLLLRANYLVKAGQPNVLILVFNRTLQEFIIQGTAEYSFSSSKVQTFRKWAMDFLWQYGVSCALPGEFEEQRLTLAKELVALIESRGLTGVYDAILIDEAQDYTPQEVEIIFRLAKSVFAVADGRQKIYKGDDGLEALSRKLTVHELKFHYRSSAKICRIADALAKDEKNKSALTPTANYDEIARPSTVLVHECVSLAEQVKTITTAVDIQLKAYPGDAIGIICAKRGDLEKVYELLSATTLQPLITYQSAHGYVPFDSSRPICLATLHSAKGLEFRAVHLAGADGLKSFPYQRNLAYMAMTRAKTSLAIYFTGELPGFLQSALAVNSPPPLPPVLEELFKK